MPIFTAKNSSRLKVRVPSIKSERRTNNRLEKKLLKRREPLPVYYFHQVDDPKSALACSYLHAFEDRYDIKFNIRLVSAPPPSYLPQPLLRQKYDVNDAQSLARAYKISRFGPQNTQPTGRESAIFNFRRIPQVADVNLAIRILSRAIREGVFLELAPKVSAMLWIDPSKLREIADKHDTLSVPIAAEMIREGNEERTSLNYLGSGSFYYAGEWYHSFERLMHLEKRLQATSRVTDKESISTKKFLFDPVGEPQPQAKSNDFFDFYFSFECPYSYLALYRLIPFAKKHKIRFTFNALPLLSDIRLRAPESKTAYSILDARREAQHLKIPFNRNDMNISAKGIKNVLAILPHASRRGLGEGLIQSVMAAIGEENIDISRTSVLRKITIRAGLSWPQVRLWIRDDQSYKLAFLNYKEMFSHSMWGTPTFIVNNTTFWGQDRFYMMEHYLNFMSSERATKKTQPTAAPK